VASLHEDWYHDERPDEAVEEREEELAGVACG
jgi:hypothetical protein